MSTSYDNWKTTPPDDNPEVTCQKCQGEDEECKHCEGSGECSCDECIEDIHDAAVSDAADRDYDEERG